MINISERVLIAIQRHNIHRQSGYISEKISSLVLITRVEHNDVTSIKEYSLNRANNEINTI